MKTLDRPSKTDDFWGKSSAQLESITMRREYIYDDAVYQKYLTRLGELIIFEPWRENYHFSQPS